MPATASDIPIELYDLILDFLAHSGLDSWNDTRQDLRNKVTVRSRDLSQLSLVCSLWARACQRKLFQVIVLCTAVEYQDVLSMAVHETSRISQYIEAFDLRPQESSKPWLHALCLQTRLRSRVTKCPGSPFPDYEGHILKLYGLDAWNMTKRGLHTSLPRRVPTCFSRGITTLVLSTVTLHSLEDVIFSARRLPSLEIIWLEQVTWEISPGCESYEISFGDLLPAWYRTLRNVSLDAYRRTTMENCSDLDRWVTLVLTCVLSKHIGKRISCDDYVLAMWMVRTWTYALQAINFYDYDTTSNLDDRALGFAILRPGHLPIHILWFVLSAIIESDPPTKSKEVLDDRRVEYIAIETPIGDADPDCIFAVRHLVAYNWAKFDQCVASLSALRGVIVGCASRKGVALFMKVVEQHIPQLKASGKLKYAVRLGDYDKGVKWEEYISNSDDKLAVDRQEPTDELWKLCSLFTKDNELR